MAKKSRAGLKLTREIFGYCMAILFLFGHNKMTSKIFKINASNPDMLLKFLNRNSSHFKNLKRNHSIAGGM